MTTKHTKDNQISIFTLLKYILTILILFIFSSSGWADIDTTITPKPEQSSQCIDIIGALERYHYLEKKLDDRMSSIILERYLKQLDPGKQLFTLDDIKSLNPYKFRLDDELKKGNLTPVFKIFNLYLKRSRQRLEYISSLIPAWEKEFDFSKNDTMVIDNELRHWQAHEQTLYPLWRNDLKNHIITLMLDDQDQVSITDTLDKIYSSRLKRLSQTNSNDIFEIFMNSVTTSFDPHTQFFPPRASEDFDIHMSLSLEGIGAVLQTEYEFTKVIRLIPKGPAEESNLLMPGDKIIGVGQGENGEIIDTLGQRIDHVVKLIRGPKNTIVRLKIIPAKKNDSTQTIQIKRDRVKLEEQGAKKEVITLDHDNQTLKIGIIEIPNFYIDFNAYHSGDPNYKSTTKDVKKLLSELKDENIDGLIIDLRDNGGGSLKEASELTGLFLTSGPTVQIKTKFRTTRLFDDDPKIEYSGPLIVLINRMSASASEIFAGAIKDYHRGVIIGTRSFGKGTVQELQPLGQGRLKITSAKFYRVSGESTQNLGVVPDLEFPQLYKIEDTGESSLDGALPWDTIIRAYYKAYQNLDGINKGLIAKYKKRAVNDPGLNYLNKRIEMADELNSTTSVSLNLDARKSRKIAYEQQELELENNYLKSTGKEPIEKFDPEHTKTDEIKQILMDQAYLVMADFINFSRDLGFSW